MVVCSREHAESVGRNDRRSVCRSRVSDSSRGACDSCLCDIVANRPTNQEAILTNNKIDVGGRTLDDIEESTAMEVGLLEVEVCLCAIGFGGREEVAQELSLQTLGNGVIELELGIKNVGSVPRLSDCCACTAIEH